jgi:hypothetical protein
MYRTPPTPEECVEALMVMIENYGYRRLMEMIEEALTRIREET